MAPIIDQCGKIEKEEANTVVERTDEDDATEPTHPSDGPFQSSDDKSSDIVELQRTFGSILSSRKGVDPMTDYSKIDFYQYNTYTYHRPPPPMPKWNGSFEILVLPRELRDRIYYHYVIRSIDLIYGRHPLSDPSSLLPDEAPGPITSLFLTCKQVYDEALQVYCRYNTIEFEHYYRKPLSGTLRLFPDKPSHLVQRVRKSYDYGLYYHLDYTGIWDKPKPRDELLEIIRDAHTFKSYFPKLRTFYASWYAPPRFFAEQEGIHLDELSKGQQVVTWEKWLRRYVQHQDVAAMRCVKFEFSGGVYCDETEMIQHQDSLNEAYGRLMREMTGWGDEEWELKESRRMWLGELENGEKERKRRLSARKSR